MPPTESFPLGITDGKDAVTFALAAGAFAAGVLLAETGYRAQIEADIKPFEGILLGVFFMTAGANLDPALCVQEWPTLATGIFAFLLTLDCELVYSRQFC